MKKTIKLYSRYCGLENQGQGRVTLDIYNGLKKDYNVIFNGTKSKSALGYLFHAIFFKAFDLRKSDFNIACSSMDTFYLDPKKSAVIVHDLIPLISQFEVDTHYNNKWWNQWGSMIFFYLTLKRALKFKKIICISSKTKNELIKAFPQVDKSKITIINNGVQDKYRSKKRANNSKFRIYYVGAIDPRKRVIDLIKWFNNSNLKNVELVIGGKGADYGLARKLSKNNQNIKLLGFVSESDMLKNYHLCDLFIFPTIEEGFGMPIIEAGCCNRPTIILEDSRIPQEVKRGCIVSTWNSLDYDINKLIENNQYWYDMAYKNHSNSFKFNYNYVRRLKNEIRKFI